MRRLQATRRTAPDPTGWAGQRAPHLGKFGPPQKDTGPLYIYISLEPRVGPNPSRVPEREGPWCVQGVRC
jgi:hypothetical protein